MVQLVLLAFFRPGEICVLCQLPHPGSSRFDKMTNDSMMLCYNSEVFGAGLCSLLSIVGHGCLADDRALVSEHLQDSGVVTLNHKAREII